MKKNIVALLVLAIVCTLCACGSSSGSTDVISKAAEEAVAEVSKETESVGQTKAETVAKETKEPETLAEAAPKFTPVVLVDNESINIEATDAEWDKIWGYQLSLILENRTDKDLMFSSDDVCVNGWSVPCVLASTIASGKKSIEQISISEDNLDECGIKDITNITIDFRVYDSNDWLADHVEDNAYVIYPIGKEADREYKREALPTDEVLVDNDDITIIITDKGIDKIWGYCLKLYIENKTDKTLMFSTDDASVNGFMCDPFWAKSLNPHTKAMTSVNWGSYTLEQQKLTPEDVKEIELPVRVHDANDYSADNILEQTFTIKAQ